MSLSSSLHRLADDRGCNDEHPVRKAALLSQHIGDAHLRQVLQILLRHLVDQNEPDFDGVQRFIEASGLRISTPRAEGYEAIATGIASAGIDGAAMATLFELENFEIQQDLRRAIQGIGMGDLMD